MKKEKDPSKEIRNRQVYSRNSKGASHFLSSFEQLDEKPRNNSKKLYNNKKNQESSFGDRPISKKIYLYKSKNNETLNKINVYKPAIRVKSLNRIPSSEVVKLNESKIELPASIYEKYGKVYSKVKSATKLYDSHVFNSSQEGEEIKFKPTKRVLSPSKNIEDIITYKDALKYRETKLTPKITNISLINYKEKKENSVKNEYLKIKNKASLNRKDNEK